MVSLVGFSSLFSFFSLFSLFSSPSLLLLLLLEGSTASNKRTACAVDKSNLQPSHPVVEIPLGGGDVDEDDESNEARALTKKLI